MKKKIENAIERVKDARVEAQQIYNRARFTEGKLKALDHIEKEAIKIIKDITKKEDYTEEIFDDELPDDFWKDAEISGDLDIDVPDYLWEGISEDEEEERVDGS